MDRIPRWMQIHSRHSLSKDKSLKSRSSRYTPKKESYSANKQDPIHDIALNMSHLVSEFPENQQKIAKSTINLYDRRLSEITKKKEPQRMGTDSGENISKEKQLQRKIILIGRKAEKQTLPEIEQIEKNSDVEVKFSMYLQYIEDLQQSFDAEKQQIESILMDQQEDIKQAKNKIIEEFATKESDIHDRALQKLIVNRLAEKVNPETKNILFKVLSEQKIPNMNTASIERKIQYSKPTEKRGNSAHSWGSNKFDKIFNTINNIKENLKEFKQLRGEKTVKRDKPLLTTTKINLVNTNQLRVKSKKTHE